MTAVMQAYRFALDPTPSQVRDLERHAGAARFAYNWALAAVKANMGQRAAEKSYGVSEQGLTAVLGWNLPALRRAWNQAKGQVAPWWGECSKEAFNTGLDAGGPGSAQLRRLQVGQAGRAQGRVPEVQSPAAGNALDPVHHRGDPGRNRPAARDVASGWADQDA